jgi:hypothetical protein
MARIGNGTAGYALAYSIGAFMNPLFILQKGAIAMDIFVHERMIASRTETVTSDMNTILRSYLEKAIAPHIRAARKAEQEFWTEIESEIEVENVAC